jgi:adenylate cyclase
LERRLAAILAADVAGYTALMGTDEAGTHQRLTSLRQEFIEPLIDEHHGRIVKLMGDGLLVEFASVVDAIACAIAWQAGVAEREAETVDDKRLRFRIGINLGDVIVEGGDIHGDGVNIAARLEGLAEPGRIWLSSDAYRQAKGKIDAGFEDLGEHEFKNVAEAVRVYRIFGGESDKGVASEEKPVSRFTKPSIAVLPFENLSGDLEHQYFSDGITEDIITELSRFRSLFVLARNSAFQHRGAVDVKAVARGLGVQYVVEGSVRRLGNRIRVTAQLIEAATGNHLWAERYDRDIQDLFTVQDEVTQAIASTIEGRMGASEAQRSRRKPTEDLVAYDYFLQGRENIERRGDPDVTEQLLQRAIELDPEFAQAYAWLSRSRIYQYHYNLSAETLREAIELARKAVSLDEADALCHAVLGLAYLFRSQHDMAGVHLDRAVALNPTDNRIGSMRALWLAFVGRTDEAVQSLDLAMRRDPFATVSYWTFLGTTLFQACRYEETIQALSHSSRLGRWDFYYLAASYAHLDQIEKARACVAELQREHPTTLGEVGSTEVFKDPADLNRLLDGLRRAGLPE